jgi:mRNA interferase MazF
MQRGDVFWFEPDPVVGSEQAGRRPALLLSRNAINRFSPVVVGIPLTTYRGQQLYPSDVLISMPEGGVRCDSVAVALQIRVVDKTRFGQKLGRLSPATMKRIEEAVLIVLDM